MYCVETYQVMKWFLEITMVIFVTERRSGSFFFRRVQAGTAFRNLFS
jgi:hypothetical protein